MKGIVFNLFERCVTQEYGGELWDDVLEAAELEGAYTSLGNYDDEQLFRLLTVAAQKSGRSVDEMERWLGRASMPALAERYPELFEPHEGTLGFLATLNDIIHPEVRKLYPGADVPEFNYIARTEHRMEMGYCSPRRMCHFAEGLIEGAAAHFGDEIRVTQPRCMKRGDSECLLVCELNDQ